MTGLLNRNTRKTLPLRKSSIRAEIKGFTARTTAVLTYYNDNRTEIEGLFKLPLDHTATIVEFEAIIDDHYIYTDVRDPNETPEKQIHHRTKNHQDGYFSISIGKILPMVVLHLQVTIVCEISALILGDALRYTLPQAFSPRVVTADEFRSSKSNQAICTSTLGYSFNIEIEIEAPCLLYGVQSNTHPIQVDAPPLSQTGSKIVVSIPEDFEPNNEVFELLMFLCRPREPYIVIEEAKKVSDEIDDEDRNPINSIMNNPILMLSYSPDIPPLTNDPCMTAQQSGEFILIIDCSITENVGKVKESCILFLKSLPFDSYFNVISLGNEFQSLYPTSQAYKPTALDAAISFVMSLIFGVTKTGALHQPLKWVFEQKALAQKPKQIFILTQGKDTGDILLGTWHRSRNKEALARCFIFHLLEEEEQYHHHLERLATITRGKYITSFDNRLQQQMATCLMAAMQPVITDVNVSWILPDAYDVIYTPEKLPSVFLGERLNLYAILASKESVPGEKPSESVNSVKEFWFEDTDLFQEEFETKQTQLPITNRDVSPYSPSAKSEIVSKEESLDYDSEVFLTEEEVRHLSNEMPFPKRSSIDRVQKWKVSKNPENHDIESDFEEDWQQNKNKQEKEVHTNQHSIVRKRNSNDGNESVGSSNSYGSNRSSSSHFYPFPGFPTRMSSCRSIEARSPHVPKMTEELFSFQEQNKSKVSGSQVNLSDYSSDHHSSGHHSSGHHSSGHHSGGGRIHKESNNLRPMARLTEALYAEKANTHLVDDSNENTIELMLENLVTEKRQKLLLWLREQEEMTQCLWPMNEYEKREYMEKQGWRDSGIGNRSSSDAHTSDIEEEIQTNRKKYFGSEEIISSHQTNEPPKDGPQPQTQPQPQPQPQTQPQTPQPQLVNETYTATSREKEKLSRKNSSNKRAGSATPKSKPKLSHKVSVSSNSSQFQKRKSKARSMWNSIIEKVRSVSAIVSEKSGEATFKRTPYDIPLIHDGEKIDPHSLYGKRSTPQQQEPLYETIDDFQPSDANQATNIKLFERKSEVPYNRPRSQAGYNSQIKTRPIIENSRTISTTSMFEIGKTEIGDIENLHLLPSQALIYLSGQCGEHAFKRIIPFQLEVDGVASGEETITSDTTVHQLAAKSIIHDLELQMEQDLEDHGKIYIKNLISEVSKAANVLSKYTTLVTIDDKSEHGNVLSSMHFDNQTTVSRCQPSDGCVAASRRKSSTAHDTIKTTPLDCFTSYAKLLFHMFPDGSWRLNEQLATIFSVSMHNLIESCPFKSLLRKDEFERSNSIHQSMWATSLALAWLQSTCESYKEEWQVAATKSQYWLIKQTLPKGLALKDLTIIAENTLKTLNTWVPSRKTTSAYWNNQQQRK